jgi:hypothetical protein
MHEQQLRAEIEAEAWRRLRQELATPEPAPPAPDEIDHHRSGSAMLKALVRFALGAFAAYLAYLASMDSGLGEFEAWLAIGGAFLITVALSMFGPARRLVHMLAETMRWVLISGAALAALWMVTHLPG